MFVSPVGGVPVVEYFTLSPVLNSWDVKVKILDAVTKESTLSGLTKIKSSSESLFKVTVFDRLDLWSNITVSPVFIPWEVETETTELIFFKSTVIWS